MLPSEVEESSEQSSPTIQRSGLFRYNTWPERKQRKPFSKIPTGKDVCLTNMHELDLTGMPKVAKIRVSIIKSTPTEDADEDMNSEVFARKHENNLHLYTFAKLLLFSKYCQTTGCLGKKIEGIYDGGKTAYCRFEDLQDEKLGKKVFKMEELNGNSEFPSTVKRLFTENTKFIVRLTYIGEMVTQSSEPKEVIKFVETVTRAPLMFSYKRYGPFTFPFDESVNHKFVESRVGFTTIVKQLEGKDGKNVYALIIDIEKAPFFVESSAIEFAFNTFGELTHRSHSISEKEKADILKDELLSPKDTYLNLLLNGMVLCTNNNGCYKEMTASGLSTHNANETNHSRPNGEAITVADHYFEILRRHLQFPELPLVEFGTGDSTTYIPLECLKVVSDQRVDWSRLTAEMQESRELTVPEHLEYQEDAIRTHLEMWGKDAHPLLKVFGIKLSDGHFPMSTLVDLLYPPIVRFQNPRHEIHLNRKTLLFDYDYQSFVRNGKIRKLAVFIFENCVEEKTFKIPPASKNLVEFIRNKGIEVKSDPIWILDKKMSRKEIAAKMIEEDVDFVLAVHKDVDSKDEYSLKYPEMAPGLPTVHLPKTTFLMIIQKTTTLEVHKVARMINCKTGGLNFQLKMNNGMEMIKNVQFVGISMSSEMVGVSYSLGEPTDLGGFIYRQRNSGNRILKLSERFKKVLEMYQLKNDRLPETLVIYRVGVDENDFKSVQEKELKDICESMKDLEKNIPKILLITVNRKSCECIFLGELEESKDVTSGTCVHKVIVTPNEPKEFLLVSEISQIGCSNSQDKVVRPVKYTILSNQTQLEMSIITQITYLLTFGDQVLYGAVDVPNVVKAAEDLVKRAKNSWESDNGDPEVFNNANDPTAVFDRNFWV